MISIYCLTDNKVPFYVGKTKNTARRMSSHIRSSCLLRDKKDIRIQDILSSGRKLDMKILCECEQEHKAFDIEANYILDYAADGIQLLNSQHNGKDKLSILERQFLILLANDNDTKDCARILYRSIRTLETVRINLKEKANVKTIAGLTKWSIEQGYVCVDI